MEVQIDDDVPSSLWGTGGSLIKVVFKCVLLAIELLGLMLSACTLGA